MSLQLYDITEELMHIHEQLLENDGELTLEIEQRMEQLATDANSRVDMLCRLIRSAEAEALTRKTEAARQHKAAAALLRTARTYKGLICTYLALAGHKFMRTPLFRTTRYTPNVPVIDVVERVKVPRECWQEKTWFSKTLAKQYYAEHGEVPGCSIKFTERLRIT
jgi:hypothetical protein